MNPTDSTSAPRLDGTSAPRLDSTSAPRPDGTPAPRQVTSICLLGSTGSIGCQTLEVCAEQGLTVAALSCGRNRARLVEQIRMFRPKLVSVAEEADVSELRRDLAGMAQPPELLWGREGNLAVARYGGADACVAAMVGVAGLEPVLAAVDTGKVIALANKETLVAGGALVMPRLAEKGAELRPVDSEHSAIWQCLQVAPRSLRRIFLTASGGPFRGWTTERMAAVDRSMALAHPTWQMGPKITIDSATLMNKGLEVIEASWLFDCPAERIEVVVHPQSIIHSMIECTDGSVLAQLGFPSMKLPIQLALTWPERLPSRTRAFDPFDEKASSLTFERPDLQAFPLLDLAYRSLRAGGTMPAALNAANETAVGLFLDGVIRFGQIPDRVSRVLEEHARGDWRRTFSYDDMMEVDRWARARAGED